jgi:hypothetical protein
VNAEFEINEAFMAKLKDFDPTIKIAWPATNFAPVSGQPYLRPTMMFGITNITGVANEDTIHYLGVFLVDLFWPENKGMTVQLAKAMLLLDYFKKGTDLSVTGVKIRVQNKPYLSRSLQEPGWSQLPINIPWRASS